jgi:autonomous glycyl radical cofactor GrcA
MSFCNGNHLLKDVQLNDDQDRTIWVLDKKKGEAREIHLDQHTDSCPVEG